MTNRDWYCEGFKDGIRCFAWWKDGVEYVGTSGKTLSLALAEFETVYNFNPPPKTASLAFVFCPRCGEQMNPKHDASGVGRHMELYSLVELYLCTPNTDPVVKDHYDNLVAWFVRNKRPDGSEPLPVSPEQNESL